MKITSNKESRFTFAFTLIALASASHVSACSTDDGTEPDGSGGSSTNSGGAGPGGAGSGGTVGSGGAGGEVGSGGAGGAGGEVGSGGTGDPVPTLEVSTVEDLTDESSTDYDDNDHGLITGATLKNWILDWENEKPQEIEGRLIILQIVPANVSTFAHITPDEENGVYTYLVGANQFNAPRDNGLSSFETDIPDGPAFDAWLKKYAVDPRKDLIVLTFEQQGNTQNSIVHSVGRAWTFFKYWGVKSDHIAILNGSVNFNAEAHGFDLSTAASHKFSVPPNNGDVTVRDLNVDNTVLSISLEEVIEILEERADDPAHDDGVRIVDARGGAEAYGLKKATSTGRTNCTSYTGTAPNAKCSTPFEGRIKGAKAFRGRSFSTVQTTVSSSFLTTPSRQPSTSSLVGTMMPSTPFSIAARINAQR